MKSLEELSGDYLRQAAVLRKRLKTARRDARECGEPLRAYELRRRADMLYEMWAEARDIGSLLARYYPRRRTPGAAPPIEGDGDA